MRMALHIGAHRTATTTFQLWLRENRELLATEGIAALDTSRTRAGQLKLLSHSINNRLDSPETRRLAAEFIRQRKAELLTIGRDKLLVSEENILGLIGDGLERGTLYPEARARLERAREIFGPVEVVGLGLRFLPGYWASCLGFYARTERMLPMSTDLEAIAHNPRSWRAIYEEIEAVFPEARRVIWTVDRFGNNPRATLEALWGAPVVEGLALTKAHRSNAAPTVEALEELLGTPLGRTPFGTYDPFSAEGRRALAETYAADLRWFKAQPAERLTFIA